MSLSSPIVCGTNAQNIARIFLSKPRLLKLIFGNRSEVETLARTLTGNKNLTLNESVSFLNAPGRIVVATCGSELKVVIGDETSDRKIEEFHHYNLMNACSDATSAGDAFAGGFLSKFMLKTEPISNCVRAGFYWAGEIVQKSGCQIPDKNSFISPCRLKNGSCTFCAKILID